MQASVCTAQSLLISRRQDLAGSRNQLRSVRAIRTSRRQVRVNKLSVLAANTTEYIPDRADIIREQSRKERRVVYTQDLWKRHRGVGRYNRHLSTLFDSSLANLWPPVAFLTGLAAAVNAINEYTEYTAQVPMSALGLTSGALSLLLVFRTNSSYGRWWEARKIWGGLLNRSRDFVRQGLTWFSVEDKALRAQLVRYTIGFAVALKVHLRGDEDMRTELTGIFTDEELEAALSEVHVPNHILRVMSELVYRADLHPMLNTEMSDNITFFEDVLGKCERILKTPIPLSYTRHTSRFLFLWLTVLPFALYKDCGWSSIPIEAFSAFCLLGIEDIGVQIEEPFSVLSCEGICGSVTANCTAMLEEDEKDRAMIKAAKMVPVSAK